MKDVSEMAQKMTSALDLDRRVMKGVGTFVAKGVFSLFDLVGKVLPRLGENFILDVGLDIVEERARAVIQKALHRKLQSAVDALGCLWSQEYKWLLPGSPDARPATLEEFRQHEHAAALKNTKLVKKKGYAYEFSQVWKLWEKSETPVEKFARELKEIGGGSMSLQSHPKNCKRDGKRKKLVVKDLMSKVSVYEKGDRPREKEEEEEEEEEEDEEEL
jgi:hypothetical protein